MEQVIYKIINVVNNKFYVGSTTNKKVRFRQHRKLLRGNRHHCKHLQAAWNKYGEDKFEFVVVENVPQDKELWVVEDEWLSKNVGQEHCYNSGYAAVAPWRGVYGSNHPKFGVPQTEDQKEKISATLKEFYAADYFNHPRVGKTHSEETKLKIRQNRTPTAGQNHYRYGKTLSEETKQKIGDAQRGKPKAEGRKVSEQGLLKIKANIEAGRSHKHWLGRKHTDEARQKMSKTVFVMPDGILFPSLSVVLKYYDMTMPTLRRALVSGEPLSKGRLVGYTFKYGGVDSKPTDNDLALIRAKLIDTHRNN
jgi:group I intron endonuclease